ncbi:MAG TPA: GNAT family N-acetyltransferase [Chloroflexaceae bacterium]|nr:GNAT family N-acetyltransferase [Chloroflexaceae bacterium]
MTAAPQTAPTGPQIFRNGRAVAVRQVRADDIGLLTGFVARLSARTCHQRYLAARSFTLATARAEAQRIAAARTSRHIALVAVAPLFGNEDLVGVAELVPMDGEAGVAELAAVVRDDMQGAGVGSLLMRAALVAAPQLGVHTLHVELLADNDAMRRLAGQAGEPEVIGWADGVLQLRVRLGAGATDRRRGPALRRAA